MTITVIKNYRDQGTDVATCDVCESRWVYEGEPPESCDTCEQRKAEADALAAGQVGHQGVLSSA